MARRPPLPGAALLRRRRERTTDRLLARRAVRDALVSLAGLINRPVRNRAGGEIGRLVDVVARWDGHVRYPPITGLVVRIARRHAWVPADQIERLTHDEIVLRSARLDLRDFARREGEVMLGKDVLDHQLVDVDGVQVIRASDLYLAPVGTRILLVGADVGIGSLVRRLGPARWRSRATPGRVVDWAAIQPFSGPTGHVRLRESHEGLQRLRPGELADLLEDLGRDARQELLESLEPEAAADALEEMEPDELESLLREANPEQAAGLLAAMEPDEAVDALRDLAVDERNELLERMPSDIAHQLVALLGYDERQAGGIMTTHLVVIAAAETVMHAKQVLAEMAEHKGDIDAIVVVDGYGRLVDDVGLFDFSLAADDVRLGQLVDESPCVTVAPDADLEDVASRLIENRRSSLLVVDGDERPVGRILADDVIDALVPERGRFRFPRLLQK